MKSVNTLYFFVQNQLVQFKELQLELGEVNELKDGLLREIKDFDKRVKNAEHANVALQDQLQTSDRARRAVSICVNDLAIDWFLLFKETNQMQDL